MKNKFLKNIAFGSFLLGSFAGTFSQLQAKSLYEAVADNDISEVHRLLKTSINLNEVNECGYLPLQCAKDMEMIKLLLGAGADINRPNQWGDTTLRTAVSAPHPDFEGVEQLLLIGADKEAKSGGGKTSVEAVQIAVKDGVVFDGRFNSTIINDEARETYKKVLELFENKGGRTEESSGNKPKSMPPQHTTPVVVPRTDNSDGVNKPKSTPSQRTPNSTPGGSMGQSPRPVGQSSGSGTSRLPSSSANVDDKKSNQGRNLSTETDRQQATTGINRKDNKSSPRPRNAAVKKNIKGKKNTVRKRNTAVKKNIKGKKNTVGKRNIKGKRNRGKGQVRRKKSERQSSRLSH